jgi:hypothetical protein
VEKRRSPRAISRSLRSKWAPAWGKSLWIVVPASQTSAFKPAVVRADTPLMQRWRVESHSEPRALTVSAAIAVMLATVALVGAIAVAARLLLY